MLGIVGVVTFFAVQLSSSGKLLLQEFVQLTNLHSNSYTTRMDFWNWAGAIIKDHPIIGTGVGGWEALYHQYQNYLTWTTLVHNHYLQIGVEAGLLGLLAFLAIVAVVVLSIIRIKKMSDENDWIIMWTIFTAITCLLMHALFDFSLSIPAVSILLFVLIGLLNASLLNHIPIKAQIPRFKMGSSMMVLLMVVILLIPASCFLMAQNKTQQATASLNALIQQKEGKISVQEYEQIKYQMASAVAFNPINAEYRANLAYIKSIGYVSHAGNDESLEARQEIYDEVNRAGELRPADMDVRNKLLTTGMLLNDQGVVLKQLEEIIHYNPNNIEGYLMIADRLGKLTQLAIEREDAKQTQYFAQELINLDERLTHQQSQVDMNHKDWRGKPLKWSDKEQEMIKQAQNIINEGVLGHQNI